MTGGGGGMYWISSSPAYPSCLHLVSSDTDMLCLWRWLWVSLGRKMIESLLMRTCLLGCFLCTPAFLPGVWYIFVIPQRSAVHMTPQKASLHLFTSAAQLPASSHPCLPDGTRWNLCKELPFRDMSGISTEFQKLWSKYKIPGTTTSRRWRKMLSGKIFLGTDSWPDESWFLGISILLCHF